MTPTLSDFFRKHKDYDFYIRNYGHGHALEAFKDKYYVCWLDTAFPPGQKTRLTESDCLDLARLWGSEPDDTIRLLSTGEKLGRWTVPNVQGIFTREYWLEATPCLALVM